MLKLSKCFIVLCCLTMPLLQAVAATHKPIASIVLRYENDTSHQNLSSRERVRLIAKAGIYSEWSKQWQSTFRLSSGLKNRQNVPAITIHRVNSQPLPDREIFVDQAFVEGRFDDVGIAFGKIPWRSKQVTDTFWDRDLNPYGIHADVKLANNDSLFWGYYLPLDGQSKTAGQLAILQYQSQWMFDDISVRFMPWLASYSGDSRAVYATRDTDVDNSFAYLSSAIEYKQWRFGADIGKSIESQRSFNDAAFADQKASYVFELRYGDLKKENATLFQFRVFRTEKYAVITEFAQNAVSRFSTNNHKGWDVRIRHKINRHTWLGLRYADSESLVEPIESGHRLRVEFSMQL